jgi:hypothetical protein
MTNESQNAPAVSPRILIVSERVKDSMPFRQVSVRIFDLAGGKKILDLSAREAFLRMTERIRDSSQLGLRESEVLGVFHSTAHM